MNSFLLPAVFEVVVQLGHVSLFLLCPCRQAVNLLDVEGEVQGRCFVRSNLSAFKLTLTKLGVGRCICYIGLDLGELGGEPVRVSDQEGDEERQVEAVDRNRGILRLQQRRSLLDDVVTTKVEGGRHERRSDVLYVSSKWPAQLTIMIARMILMIKRMVVGRQQTAKRKKAMQGPPCIVSFRLT